MANPRKSESDVAAKGRDNPTLQITEPEAAQSVDNYTPVRRGDSMHRLTPGSETDDPGGYPSATDAEEIPKKPSKGKDKSKKPKGKPRGGHNQGPQRGEMGYGREKPRPSRSAISEDEPSNVDDGHFHPNQYPRMTAFYFHKNNDLSRSRGVGYTPEEAVPRDGPGVTPDVEKMYNPCTLLSEFKYTTWADTVVPLRNHNVVQGFNEMALFLMKLAAKGDESVNHEEAFMASSFLSNIRNDLGEHPPNVLALLERIDFLTRDDGSEKASPDHVVIDPCVTAKMY